MKVHEFDGSKYFTNLSCSINKFALFCLRLWEFNLILKDRVYRSSKRAFADSRPVMWKKLNVVGLGSKSCNKLQLHLTELSVVFQPFCFMWLKENQQPFINLCYLKSSFKVTICCVKSLNSCFE